MSERKNLRKQLRVLLALNVIVVLGLAGLLLSNLVGWEGSGIEIVREPVSTTGQHVVFAEEGVSEPAVEADTPVVSELFQRGQPGRASRDTVSSVGRLALVIDDLGFSLVAPTVRGILDLPVPFTAAVIPGQDATEAVANEAANRGHAVIAHVPMRPLGSRDDVTESYLHAQMRFSEFQAFMETVAAVPHASGLSNHQGSAATQDLALMEQVALWCSQRGWFVLDSITHGKTVLYQQARAQGVPALQRDLYLDHDPDPEAIREQLRKAAELATESARPVIVIAHPRASTLEVLQAEIPRIVEQGIDFVRLKESLAVNEAALAAREQR